MQLGSLTTITTFSGCSFFMSRGGLGIRKTEEMNVALLGKQAWRILTKPESFVASVLLSKYCKDESFSEAIAKPNASWIWKSLLTGRDFYSERS